MLPDWFFIFGINYGAGFEFAREFFSISDKSSSDK
jgi:hypothetical protein